MALVKPFTTDKERKLRNLKIARLVLKGFTMRNIGRTFGISGSRVSQLSIREYCRMLGIKRPEHVEPKLTITYVRNKLKDNFLRRLENRIKLMQMVL